MIPPLVDMTPQGLADELLELGRETLKGIESLSRVDAGSIQVGFTPKTAVWQREGVTLYRYTPRVETPKPVPLLISYALVNRPYMVDLEPGRSMVQSLLDLGLDVYLIDWGYPARIDRWRSIDDYVNGLLSDCVDQVCQASGQPAINLLGICQGGAFSLCYAALHPEKVKNLITMVTPVDFHATDDAGAPCGMLNSWAMHLDVDVMADALGNIPGDFMNFGFVLMKPFQLNVAKYAAMLDIVDDEKRLANFLRMEKWIFDSPDQAGETWRQFLTDFYQQNKLVKGEVELGGRRVDLKQVTMPVFNIYAELDHLVPPQSSMPLGEHVGTEDYSSLSFPTGHIGMYVSGKVQKVLPPAIVEWLDARS
ncbi:MAG: class III poly(R)-hydroxyalkanoic acid synthase subunit PhaC [Caldilineae bacterium]|nr:class III poly(R)-hydroxyalkanoic acid synthase subunit PhaC [Chloroflexota bacterium]MCB9177621.1 class III poly(R)-hydroxyalkanoic acid synthase subunit PhaC [Caldilineae bacterium]